MRVKPLEGANLAETHNADDSTEIGAQALGQWDAPHFELARVSVGSVSSQDELPVFLLADIQNCVVIVASEPVLPPAAPVPPG